MHFKPGMIWDYFQVCCTISGLGSLRVDNMLQNKLTVATCNSVPQPVNTCISNTQVPPLRSSARASHLSYNHHLLPTSTAASFLPSIPCQMLKDFPAHPATTTSLCSPNSTSRTLLHHSYQKCQFSPEGSSDSR